MNKKDAAQEIAEAVDRLERLGALMLAGVARLESAADRAEEAARLIAADLAVATTKIAGVAVDLDVAQKVVDSVRDDLQASRGRADEITDGSPGEAADAGAQNPKEEP